MNLFFIFLFLVVIVVFILFEFYYSHVNFFIQLYMLPFLQNCLTFKVHKCRKLVDFHFDINGKNSSVKCTFDGWIFYNLTTEEFCITSVTEYANIFILMFIIFLVLVSYLEVTLFLVIYCGFICIIIYYY